MNIPKSSLREGEKLSSLFDCLSQLHDTFNRIFNLIIPGELVGWLVLWMEQSCPEVNTKDIIHLGSKVLEAYS